MKIILNKETEIRNVNVISEKKINIDNQNFRGILINVIDSEYDVAKTEELFKNITSIEVVRNKEDEETVTLDYSKYNNFAKTERKITDDMDITTVTMIME